MAEVKDNTVYISFNSKYKDKVQEFEKMLEGKSISKKSSITEDIDTISEFETEIGRGRIVVIFYCREYFKSSHCMNEYAEIRRNQEGKKVYTVKCDDIVFDSNFTMDVCRHWGGEKAVVNETDEDARTEVERAERANEFYLERGTRYYFRKLNAYFRDKPYTDASFSNENGDVESVDNLEQLSDKIFQYIEGARMPNNLVDVRIPLPCAILEDIDKKHFVMRDSDVEKVNQSLSQKKIVNVVGIGGCGKSTISMLYLQKYRKLYSNITDIINGDVYREFCEMYVEKHPICQWVYSSKAKKIYDDKKTFESIIKQFCKYSAKDSKSNLFVLDVNETADENDYAKVRTAIAIFEKYCVANKWKLLVLSRVPLCDKLASTYNDRNGYIDISRFDKIEFEFIKELFFYSLKEKREIYKHKFDDKELKVFFSKLGNLPVLVKALAEFLDDNTEQSSTQIMAQLGDGDLSNDLKSLDCTSINKPKVYDKIGNFLQRLCRFCTLRNETQKNIVRHMMLWEADYFSVDLIKRLVDGESNRSDVAFTNSLRDLEHKCWLDSRSNEGKKQYKMHSLIAKNCFNQIMNPKKVSFDEFGNQVEVPNPDYEVNEKYRDYLTYFNNVCAVICMADTIMPSETEKCIKNIDTIYLPWLKKQDPDLPLEQTDKYGFTYINIPVENYGEIKMIKVRGGSFVMGCTSDSDAMPHKVTLDDFYIAETQVTQALWEFVMKETKLRNPSRFKNGGQYPVENVSWYDCFAFVMKLNEIAGMCFRLPTEAEWEYAARSRGQVFKYSWNAEARNDGFFSKKEVVRLKDFAWFKGNSGRKTHPVATDVKPNAIGIYDMSGNVWEWCQDWYAKDYFQKCKADVKLSTNPQGPTLGASRVLRGGSWDYLADRCRVSYRSNSAPNGRSNRGGLRLILSSPKKEKNII